MKCTMWSFPSSFGKCLPVASLVMATEILRLLRRKPTCCPPGSWERKREGGKKRDSEGRERREGGREGGKKGRKEGRREGGRDGGIGSKGGRYMYREGLKRGK